MIFGFVQDFPYLCAASNVVSDPFFTRKTPISENNSLMTPFLLCSCFRTHPTNTTSQNIGGTDAWAVLPTSNFGGTVFPVPPRSLPMILLFLSTVSEDDLILIALAVSSDLESEDHSDWIQRLDLYLSSLYHDVVLTT